MTTSVLWLRVILDDVLGSTVFGAELDQSKWPHGHVDQIIAS